MHQQLLLDEAASLVKDGMTIALGGMTMYRRPTAFVRALLRRNPRPKNLTLLCFTAGYESDLLVGAGCVSAIRSCYFGLESFGFAPMFTEAAQKGVLQIIEETEASLALGVRAGIAGVGYMPSHAWVGTDMPQLRPDVMRTQDPYSGEELIAFPAINCDVAVIHGLEADYNGNIKINNNAGVDVELIYLADRVIATVERLVEESTRSLDLMLIPAPGADYIVQTPKGAWPTSCYPEYPMSGSEIVKYIDACNAGAFDSYLEDLLQTTQNW